jgi:hypothetical protein
VDGCESLHQLIGGKHPIIYRVSTIGLVMQDFATIHRPPEMMDQPHLGQTVSIPQRVSVEELEPKAKESRVVTGCGFCQQKMVDLMGCNQDERRFKKI